MKADGPFVVDVMVDQDTNRGRPCEAPGRTRSRRQLRWQTILKGQVCGLSLSATHPRFGPTSTSGGSIPMSSRWRSETLAKIWAAPEASARVEAFDAEMAPYLNDPFRGAVQRRVLGKNETPFRWSFPPRAPRSALLVWTRSRSICSSIARSGPTRWQWGNDHLRRGGTRLAGGSLEPRNRMRRIGGGAPDRCIARARRAASERAGRHLLHILAGCRRE